VDSEKDADEAIEAGADIIMLDNFDGEGLRVAAKSIRGRWAGKKQFLLECSGGLTPDNVQTYINNGKTTHFRENDLGTNPSYRY
jgi:nicotinate-nucleotide pyrophosphorylase (carboxylating)